MSNGHAFEERATAAARPPMRQSNEAERDQLRVAQMQGDAYGRAMEAMAAEGGDRERFSQRAPSWIGTTRSAASATPSPSTWRPPK